MLRDAKYSSSVFLFLIGVHVDEGSWSGETIRGGGGGGGGMFLGAPRFGCCQGIMSFARCGCTFNPVGMVRRWCEGLHVSLYSLVGSTYGDMFFSSFAYRPFLWGLPERQTVFVCKP